MKEWGVTRASRRRGNGCPASHARCHTRCGHELPRAPTCCARARRRSEGPTSPRHRPHGMVSLCAPQPRRLPRSAVLFKATSSTLFRPFLHFHFFFPILLFITGGAACTGGASTASLPANPHSAASPLAEPPRAVANGL